MKRQTTCNDKALVLFHYGDLDTGERQCLLNHLEVCPECRSRLAELQRTLSDLPTPHIDLSDVEKHRLTAVITDRVAQRSKPKRWIWGSALAAAATLVVCLSILPGGFGIMNGLPRSEAELGMLQDMELLQNMDMLQNFELLQEMERTG